MGKKIIIADCNCLVGKDNNPIGHYLAFFKNTITVLGKHCDIKVACSAEYAKELDCEKIILKGLNCDIKRGFIDRLIRIKNEFISFKNVLKETADVIIFQAGGFATQCVALLATNKKTIKGKKIIIVVYYDIFKRKYKFKSVINSVLYWLVKEKINGIITGIDEVGRSFKKEYIVITDHFGREPKRPSNTNKMYDIGMFGLMSQEKNVEEVIDAFKNTGKKIYIAGYFKEVKYYNYIIEKAENEKNIIIINRYLDEKEYNEEILKCKYIVLPYKLDFKRSSGVLFDALFLGVPVIVGNMEYFNFIREKNLGYQYIKSLKEIEPIMDDEANYEEFKKNIYMYMMDKNLENENNILKMVNE